MELFKEYSSLLKPEEKFVGNLMNIMDELKHFKSGKMKTIKQTINENVLLVKMDKDEITNILTFGIRWLRNRNKYLLKMPIIYHVEEKNNTFTVLIQKIDFDIQLKSIDDELFPFIYDPENVEFLPDNILSKYKFDVDDNQFFETEEITSIEPLLNVNHMELVVSLIENMTDFDHVKDDISCFEYEILVKLTPIPDFYFIDFGLCYKQKPYVETDLIFEMSGLVGVIRKEIYTILKSKRTKFLNDEITADEYGKFRSDYISKMYEKKYLLNPDYIVDARDLKLSQEL